MMSVGSNDARVRIALIHEPLDGSKLLAEVASRATGATVLFLGTVRDVHDGRAVDGMEYSAYESMASGLLREIALEAVAEYGTAAIAVEHRIGALELGDTSVAIAVSHPHRGPAFDAARYIIEELKRRVPIWKLEYYSDGTREWVDPTRENVKPLAGE